MKVRVRGRGWAYICAWLGGVASISANVAHSFVPPAATDTFMPPADWSPQTGAVIASVFWPVALVAMIEAFARVPWPTGWRFAVMRFGGLLPVAVVAAVVSYLHLSGLLASYGAGWFEVHVGPLAVDGLMVMATGALIVTSRPAAEKTPVEPVPEPVNPSPAPESSPQVAPNEEPPQSVSPSEPPPDRRIEALAALLAGAEPATVAAQVGVSVQTVQRWADKTAAQARRPRGGRANPAPEPAAVNGRTPDLTPDPVTHDERN